MKQNKAENFNNFSKESAINLSRLDKINEIAFWIANQICIWLLLPLLSAISADFLIPNNQFSFFDESDRNNLIVRCRGQILLLSLFMIFCVLLNNFKNTWLSRSSEKQLLERVEEMRYKNLLFMYLFVAGIIIFFFSSKRVGPIFCSAIVCGLHFVYLLALIKIRPYKQSLTVHTVTIFINNGIVMVFLIVINLLNYVDDLDEIVVIGLGFFLTGGCGLSLILSFIRFYYELRYGRELEEKIMD